MFTFFLQTLQNYAVNTIHVLKRVKIICRNFLLVLEHSFRPVVSLIDILDKYQTSCDKSELKVTKNIE
jgi:hypothetical protein